MQPLRNLGALEVCAAVAELGSFTAAADRLGLTKAAVSLTVKQVEAALGRTLILRTTRRVRATAEGAALFTRCAPALALLRDALAETATPAAELGGTLRITAPANEAAHGVARALAEFASRHPRLRVALFSSDTPVDLIARGIDLAIRFGRLRDSSLRAIKLADFAEAVLASPDYLRRAGRPGHPRDLAGHRWIAFTLMRTPLTWTFTGPRNQRVTVRTTARLEVDSPAALAEWLEAGMGISILHPGAVADALASGRLVRVLEEWRLPAGGVYAVFAGGRHPAPPAQAFLEHYRDFLGRLPDPSRAAR